MPMEKITTQPSQANINRLLALLGETHAQFEGLTRSLLKDELCEPLSEGEWSFTEILAHLLCREEIISQSIYYALFVDDPILRMSIPNAIGLHSFDMSVSHWSNY
jgi:hypothetical protein